MLYMWMDLKNIIPRHSNQIERMTYFVIYQNKKSGIGKSIERESSLVVVKGHKKVGEGRVAGQ